jgi:hypothetical protein
MKSIYQKAMGSDFEKLHPKIQNRFGFTSKDGIAMVGKGIMTKVWHGPKFTLPFLCLGSKRNILFPEAGQNIPFSIENYAYWDSFGRETMSFIRSFRFPKRLRRFDATMIYSQQRKKVIDYLGTQQQVAVDIDLGISENGGLTLESAEQRFFTLGLKLNCPELVLGRASVCEWFDDTIDRYRIKVEVNNSIFGKLFGYEGVFDVFEQLVHHDGGIPLHIKPLFEEGRE